MARFKIYIEYEGTRYSGWQIQPNARTVQGDISDALKNIFKSNSFEFYGSGRTDAGVHALLQVAHLDVKTMLAPEIIRMKLNDMLHRFMRVMMPSDAAIFIKYHEGELHLERDMSGG
jgi:tRNA pseudouridine38-40 synthase